MHPLSHMFKNHSISSIIATIHCLTSLPHSCQLEYYRNKITSTKLGFDVQHFGQVQNMKSLFFGYHGWTFVVTLLQTTMIIITGIYNMVHIPERFVQLLIFALSASFISSLYSVGGEKFRNKASRQHMFFPSHAALYFISYALFAQVCISFTLLQLPLLSCPWSSLPLATFSLFRRLLRHLRFLPCLAFSPLLLPFLINSEQFSSLFIWFSQFTFFFINWFSLLLGIFHSCGAFALISLWYLVSLILLDKLIFHIHWSHCLWKLTVFTYVQLFKSRLIMDANSYNLLICI